MRLFKVGRDIQLVPLQGTRYEEKYYAIGGTPHIISGLKNV